MESCHLMGDVRVHIYTHLHKRVPVWPRARAAAPRLDPEQVVEQVDDKPAVQRLSVPPGG